MDYKEDISLWTKKDATLSDKTAQKEFDLTQEEIIKAIKAGKLHYRHNTLFGNPCLKLLRREATLPSQYAFWQSMFKIIEKWSRSIC